MKTIINWTLCLILVISFPATAFAYGEGTEDFLIQTDPVESIYVGRVQASRLISQLQFTDLPANQQGQDAIIRSGALEAIRPAARTFRPNAPITREEAIAYSLRAAGLSEMAMLMAGTLDIPPNTPLGTAWSLGYLQLASTMGMILPENFDAALSDVNMQHSEIAEMDLDIAPSWDRSENATREEVALWLATALQFTQADIFENNAVGISLQSFTDWNSVSMQASTAVEQLLRNNVITGQTANTFGPNSAVTRQQMTQFIRNLDEMHYGILGLDRRVGTVADIWNEQYTETGAGTLWNHIHVRRADGGVDMLQFTLTGGPSPQTGALDAVTLRGGNVGGLNTLEVGDQIEYLIHSETNTVWYVFVTNEVVTQTFRGRLEMIDMERGTMTFRNEAGIVYTFPMSNGLYGTDHNDEPFIRMRGNQLYPAAEMPRGTLYDITLVGNVITSIYFVGEEVLIPENRGLVIENNPHVGYMTILDSNRQEQSFTYNPGQLVVHRRQFFDMRDTIGGWHEMFPGVRPSHRVADISDVIPGDIVVFRTAEDDPFRIVELNAAENTTSRYGRIREIRDHGGYFDMMMEFENGQTAWYTFVDGIRVMENGRPVSANRIQLGDWARIIINQAIIAPGVMMESVRDIALDGGGRHINSLITGRIAGFLPAQNMLQIQHARELTPAGWRNHSPLTNVNIGGQNVRYYQDGRPVTLEHINRYLQRSDATVYIALENHFAGERAIMVSIRSGRDELVRTGTVLHSANNEFSLLEIPGDIRTDAGTIVVRNGRLVEQNHIFSPDWARVALNGYTAAVVDIGIAPATDGVQIIRGRVSQVWPFESFRVETMSIFDGFRWNFTPIQREFTIDHDTLFINGGGVTSIDDFLGFTDASVVNDVFNVVVEGGRAVRVIDAPFTEPIPQLATAPGHLTMRGIIYEIDDDTLSVNNLTVFNPLSGAWDRVSIVNPTGSVTVSPNTIIVDRNQVIPANQLRVGQQILAFTPDRRDEVDLEPGLSANAFIVLVEN